MKTSIGTPMNVVPNKAEFITHLLSYVFATTKPHIRYEITMYLIESLDSFVLYEVIENEDKRNPMNKVLHKMIVGYLKGNKDGK